MEKRDHIQRIHQNGRKDLSVSVLFLCCWVLSKLGLSWWTCSWSLHDGSNHQLTASSRLPPGERSKKGLERRWWWWGGRSGNWYSCLVHLAVGFSLLMLMLLLMDRSVGLRLGIYREDIDGCGRKTNRKVWQKCHLKIIQKLFFV